MTDLDLRDVPSRKLLEQYRQRFVDVDVDSVLLYLDLQRTFRHTEQLYDEVFAQFDLTEAKFIVLMLLYREPEKKLLPSILAEKAGVKRATITGVINGLAKNNWVEKVPDKVDKRATWVCLTASGLAQLEKFLPKNFQTAQKIMSYLNETDKKHLNIILDKISQTTDEMRKDELI